MKRSVSKLFRLTPLLVLVLLLGQALPAAACSIVACWIFWSDGSSDHGYCIILQQAAAAREPGARIVPMGETTVTATGPGRARVSISGFATASMDTSCAAGLSQIEGIRRVNSTSVIHSDTFNPLAEVHFTANRESSSGFADEAGTAGLGRLDREWQGFFTRVSSPVPDHTHLTYVLDVSLQPGFTADDLAQSLRADGYFGTAKANDDGSLNPDHIHFRALKDTPVTVRYLPERERQDQ